MTRPVCIFPWFHQLIETNGIVRPCCIWNGKQSHIYDVNNFFHGDFMNQLRDRMLAGEWPDECTGCKRDENMGKRSQRLLAWEIAENIGFTHENGPRLMSHEIHPSNVCNIKCRTCEPASSTKWSADAQLVGMDKTGVLQSGWHLTAASARDVRRLLFLGGESLMHQDLIFDSLSKVDTFGDISKVEVVICTNMTLQLWTDIIPLLSRCQYVSFSCSIDGYADLNEYIRSDSRWVDILATCEQMTELCRSHEHMKMHIHPVISIMNINRLTDMFDWWESIGGSSNAFSYIWCYHPRYYDARYLPMHYRQDLVDRYRRNLVDYPQYMNILESIILQLSATDVEDSVEVISQFGRITKILDEKRGLHLIDYNPEIASICGL